MRVRHAVQRAPHASSSALFTTTARTASRLSAERRPTTAAAAAAAAGSAGGAAPPSAEEAELLRVIESAPKDVERVRAALEPVVARAGGGKGGSLLPTLGGEWAVSWWEGAAKMASSMQQSKGEGGSEEQAPKTPLSMLSFGVLPDIAAPLVASYNVVSEDLKSYDLLQVFAVPGVEGARAAMVLHGESHPDDGGDAPNRLHVKFRAVQVVPERGLGADVDAVLTSAGLGEAVRKRLPLPAAAGGSGHQIDIEHISGALRVHRGGSGSAYVLRRAPVPFDL